MSVSEIEFDPATGELLAPARVVEQLLAAARAAAPMPAGELTASGAVEAGAAHPRLGLALRIATRPLVELRLERGERSAAAWVAPGGSALLVPVDDGRRRLLTLETSHLALALVRLNDLGPRPVDESRPVIALTPADLTRAVSARDTSVVPQTQADEREALGELLAGLRARWRVETHWTPPDNSPGTRSLEVLDSDAGLWLVVPDGPSVDLWPTTPTIVFRLLCGLLPHDQELGLFD